MMIMAVLTLSLKCLDNFDMTLVSEDRGIKSLSLLIILFAYSTLDKFPLRKYPPNRSLELIWEHTFSFQYFSINFPLKNSHFDVLVRLVFTTLLLCPLTKRKLYN